MIQYIKIAFTFIFIVGFFQIAQSQVETVKYHLRYNENRCLWEICLVIEKGSATRVLDRAQFNSQISVVIPSTSDFVIEELVMPLQANQNYNGVRPLTWFINNKVVAPQSQIESTFLGIAPVLNPTSFYNNLAEGDTIVLFRASISNLTNCGKEVRFYENGVDPSSEADGMNGGDFSNGFTLGSITQKYRGNIASKLPSAPIITNIQTDCSAGLSISVQNTPLNCHGATSYQWVGPAQFSSNEKNVNIPNANSANNGEYTLHVSDILGCKDTLKIKAQSAPNAGVDGYINCIENGITTLSTLDEGFWRLLHNESIGTAEIVSPQDKVSFVRNFSRTGWYTFERVGETCSDKVRIFVDDKCSCNFDVEIESLSGYEFCGSIENVLLTGDPIPSGKYKWIYKKNNGDYKLAPGLDNQKDFNIIGLGEGQHSFKRINFSEDLSCADTTYAIVLAIKPRINIDEGLKITPCFETDRVQINATGIGSWKLGGNSAGTLNISNPYSTTTEIYNFSAPGLYFMIYTNEICSDTITIDAKPLCGCAVADVAENINLCPDDNLIIHGSCVTGSWTILNNPMGISIDSVKNGDAYISVDRLLAPKSFDALFTVDLGSIILKDTTTITQRPKPIISIGWDFDYCRGSDKVIVTSSGANSNYLWSNGDTNRYTLVSPEVTTHLWLKASNEFGCFNTDTILISVHEKPKGQIQAVYTVNEGEKLVINAGFWTDAVHYEWTGPNGFYSTKKNLVFENAKVEHAGVYTLAVVSQFDCYAYITTRVEVMPSNFDLLKGGESNSDKAPQPIRSRSHDSRISLSPNPAVHHVNVTHDFGVQKIELMSIKGQKLLDVIPTLVEQNSTIIDISGIDSGLYLITCYYHDYIDAKKLLIIRE
jgi:hypothetical protein